MRERGFWFSKEIYWYHWKFNALKQGTLTKRVRKVAEFSELFSFSFLFRNFCEKNKKILIIFQQILTFCMRFLKTIKTKTTRRRPFFGVKHVQDNEAKSYPAYLSFNKHTLFLIVIFRAFAFLYIKHFLVIKHFWRTPKMEEGCSKILQKIKNFLRNRTYLLRFRYSL